MHKIFTFLFLAWGPAAAALPDTCVPALIAHIKTLAERSPAPVRAEAAELGLPSALREAVAHHFASGDERERWIHDHFGAAGEKDRLPGDTLLETDLGSSLWDKRELSDWRALDPLTLSPDAAHHEILKIAHDEGHCPPGLDKILCQSLRDSLAIYTDAARIHRNPRQATLFAQQRHVVTNTPYFPWLRVYRRKAEIQMGVSESFAVMRTLIRETHISHLLYVDLNHRVRLGRRLPQGLRLQLAKIPALIEFAPLLEIHPPEAEPVPRLGAEPGGHVELLSGRYAMGLRDGYLSVRALARPKLLHVQYFVDEMRLAAEVDRRTFQTALEVRLNRVARQFWRKMRMDKTPTFLAEWSANPGVMEITAPEARPRDELLFYYFLLDGSKG